MEYVTEHVSYYAYVSGPLYMIIKKSEQCSTFQINVIFSLNMTRTGVFHHSEIRNGHAASRKIIRFGGVKMSKSNKMVLTNFDMMLMFENLNKIQENFL